MRVPDLQAAIDLVNAHQYANGVALFTQNGATARHFAHEIQVGMVGVNVPIPVPVSFHAFGGWRSSSFGDTGLHGDESVRFYTRSKSVTSSWSQVQIASGFMMPTHDD